MMTKKEPAKTKDLSKEEEIDARLATAMGHAALATPEIKQGLEGMLSSAEPTMAAGQVLANMVMQMREQAESANLGLSDNIWMAQGGVADRLAETMASNIGAPDQAGAIWEEALNVFKLASKVGNDQQGAPAAPQGPAMPSGPIGAAQSMGVAV